MVSKIDNSTPGMLRRVDSARTEGLARSANTPATDSASQPSRAPAGSLLERATTLAAAAPEIDQARVDSIKAAIAQGEYRIDPEATARAFIAMELS